MHDWPTRGESVTATLRPVMLAVLVAIWLGTALVCLGPGYDWGLRIMAQAGAEGWLAAAAVVGGAILDAVLGLGLLWRRWRRLALRAQIGLMLAYMVIITMLVPLYWSDPFAAVGKNAVLIVATLWLLWTEPGRKEAPPK
ncbi:DoxX-like family protein [Modicisalibacter luteus]|uniref:DoxX-like family protein n=1 Tax=Modicisalibacter luteus TaxID=453962 RepID=UPI003634A7C6